MAPKPALNRSAFKDLAVDRAHRNMYIYLYVFIYMCMSIYLSIYIYVYIYIYSPDGAETSVQSQRVRRPGRRSCSPDLASICLSIYIYIYRERDSVLTGSLFNISIYLSIYKIPDGAETSVQSQRVQTPGHQSYSQEYVYIFVCIYLYVYVYLSIYIYTYAYIYIYIHLMAPKPAFNRSAFKDLAVNRAYRISHQYVYLYIYIYI